MEQLLSLHNEEDLFFKHAITTDIERDAITRHVHQKYELIYYVSGDATSVVEGRKHKLRAGDLLLIRPSRYHLISFESSATYERYNILFDPRALGIESVWRLDEGIEAVSLRTEPRAVDFFLKMELYCKRFDPPTFKKLAVSMIEELFCLLSILPTVAKSTYQMAVSPPLETVLRYINENLTVLKDVDEVAEKCFVSKSYLFRLFRQELMETPKKYITKKRLLMAREMIENGTRPTAAFELCSFEDYTTFYRNYISFFGQLPSK